MEDKVDQDIYSTLTDFEDKPLPQSEEEEEEEEPEEQKELTKSRLYLVGLGIFLGLVAGTLIYMSVRMVTVLENINHLTTKRRQLISETKTMEDEINELNREIDKKCGPCPDKWILFDKKCYLFYDSPAPWKTWEQSQRFCQDKRTNLLAIGSLQEQEFVSKNIKYYHDEYHGYWIGLQLVNNSWTWVTGNVDTLGFWINEKFNIPEPKALVIPGKKPSQSWKKARNGFLNKFICERDAREL